MSEKAIASEAKARQLDEARKRMLEKIEQAKQEYFDAKKQLYPELYAPPPAEATRIIDEQQKRIKELEAKLALLEAKKK
jgi:predicted metal-binding transcription factor (methanogenesis marker protein 9)